MTRIVITRPARRPYEVHLHNEGETAWRTGFNVTTNFWRTKLKVSLLMVQPGGTLPTRDWWRENAPRYFPFARSVTWDRMTPSGLRTVTLKLQPLSYWRIAVMCLRAFYPLTKE